MNINDLLVDSKDNLILAIKKINSTGLGIVFVTKNGKAFGSLTDGDIRRALLKGAETKDELINFCNKKPVILSKDSSKNMIQKNLSSRIKVIPLVDENEIIVDFATIKRLHHFMVMEPVLSGNEINYVTECIKTNWISSQGKYVKNFESEIKNMFGANFCISTSNGTTALHLALEALDIGEGDEVIVPDFTFGASVNSIIHSGATPVLVDVEKDSWNLCPKAVKDAINKKTKAIMPVHIYGNPCDMKAIMSIAKKNKLLVIEDCAEAFGATVEGKYVGTFGDSATFSFFANKVITSGEGGAVLFNSREAYEKAAVIRDHGMSKNKRYWHERIGYNYRLTNLQAAIGCAQLEQFESFKRKRKDIWNQYDSRLKKTGYFSYQKSLKNSSVSHWLYSILLRNSIEMDRDQLLESLKNYGIETRPVFYPMSRMPAFKSLANSRKNHIANSISQRGFSLPSSITLKRSEIDFICDSLITILQSNLSEKITNRE